MACKPSLSLSVLHETLQICNLDRRRPPASFLSVDILAPWLPDPAKEETFESKRTSTLNSETSLSSFSRSLESRSIAILVEYLPHRIPQKTILTSPCSLMRFFSTLITKLSNLKLISWSSVPLPEPVKKLAAEGSTLIYLVTSLHGLGPINSPTKPSCQVIGPTSISTQLICQVVGPIHILIWQRPRYTLFNVLSRSLLKIWCLIKDGRRRHPILVATSSYQTCFHQFQNRIVRVDGMSSDANLNLKHTGLVLFSNHRWCDAIQASVMFCEHISSKTLLSEEETIQEASSAEEDWKKAQVDSKKILAQPHQSATANPSRQGGTEEESIQEASSADEDWKKSQVDSKKILAQPHQSATANPSRLINDRIVKARHCKPVSFVKGPSEAEALCIYEAMLSLQNQQSATIIIESDAKAVILAIKLKKPPINLKRITEDILHIASSFKSLSFIFIPRSENSIADDLAS